MFEGIATSWHWPREWWPLLLQCKLVGKAQEAVSSLSLADGLDYGRVKSAVLNAYELVPEAYRQKFRNLRKRAGKSYVEFAKELELTFDRWCAASKCDNFKSLRELIMVEGFKNTLPDKVSTYLNELKVETLSQAAVHADEFVLAHKISFTNPGYPEKRKELPAREHRPSAVSGPKSKEERVCFFCHRPGHMIAECRKMQQHSLKASTPTPPKLVGMVHTVPNTPEVPTKHSGKPVEPESSYAPFLSSGSVSLSGNDDTYVSVRILRDTGATQSVILSSVLPWSDDSYCGYSVLLQGIEMGHVPAPLHFVNLRSNLVNGRFKVAVQPALPAGVSLILGNDVAGGLVKPVVEVVTPPAQPTACDDLQREFPNSFPACVVTRAQAKKFGQEYGMDILE